MRHFCSSHSFIFFNEQKLQQPTQTISLQETTQPRARRAKSRGSRTDWVRVNAGGEPTRCRLVVQRHASAPRRQHGDDPAIRTMWHNRPGYDVAHVWQGRFFRIDVFQIILVGKLYLRRETLYVIFIVFFLSLAF